MERVGGRQEKMEGYCSTGLSPQWAVVPMEEEGEEEEEEDEEEEEEEEEEKKKKSLLLLLQICTCCHNFYATYLVLVLSVNISAFFICLTPPSTKYCYLYVPGTKCSGFYL